jgi:pantetheine-phosphate adenylyltransferase
VNRINKIAVFPGSFDPFTNGHIDIVERALGVFEGIIIAIAEHTSKVALFSIKERVELVKEYAKVWEERLTVTSFSGLLVDFMKEHNIFTIVRGLRAHSDYEYEVQMAGINRLLYKEVDTLFLPAGERSSFISSSFIKQVASLNGDISTLVPTNVATALKNKYKQ